MDELEGSSSCSDSDVEDPKQDSASETTGVASACSSSSSLHSPLHRKRKRPCKWSAEWKRYSMARSKKGTSYAYCTVCYTDLLIASGGVSDVRRHVDGKKHKDNARLAGSQKPIRAALRSISASASSDRQATVAEVYFAGFYFRA